MKQHILAGMLAAGLALAPLTFADEPGANAVAVQP